MRAKEDGVILDVRGLIKVFGSGQTEVRAVDEVDLSVRRGEIVLIIGPSGSGKTTLLTLIGGILKPSAGTVRIGQSEITSMSEWELSRARRSLVGFIFQQFNLLESLSALENVEVVLNFAGVNGKAARKRATSLLSDLGMETRLGSKPKTLSGGESQRVAVARALANSPQIVLADEPTANLDFKHGYEVVTLLRDIAKEQGRAVIIVSHDQRLYDVADRVLLLEDGRLKQASGTLPES